MKILLIMPHIHGYENIFVKILEGKGHEVSYIPDFDESLIKRVLRKFISIRYLQNRYLKSEIKQIARTDIDHILIIRGYYYSANTISWIKNKFSKAKIVLYQWDPISISHFDKGAFKLFDKLFSFDKNDCIKYNMNYYPLFYQNISEKNNVENDKNYYDFSFIGTGHSQRLYVLGKLIKIFKEKGYTFYIRIYIQKLVYYKNWLLNVPGFRHFPKEFISFKPINKSFADKIVSQSKIVIDVNHPSQTGLSIRVIEVLGVGKKIITTNKEIINEPFYNKNVIGIIENCNLPFDIEFMLKNNDIVNVENLEINRWIERFIEFYKK